MLNVPTYKQFIQENLDVYNKSLRDKYWTEISSKFPNYNDPNDLDCEKAVNFIFSNMKKKYKDEDWNKIEKEIKSNIKDGIT